MPTYGGVDLFGIAVSTSIQDRPREVQVNSYFGLHGLEILDGGARGRTITVTGVLVQSSESLLIESEEVFRNRIDGVAREFIDKRGIRRSNVILEEFQSIGKIRRTTDGFCVRPYRARFLELG